MYSSKSWTDLSTFALWLQHWIYRLESVYHVKRHEWQAFYIRAGFPSTNFCLELLKVCHVVNWWIFLLQGEIDSALPYRVSKLTSRSSSSHIYCLLVLCALQVPDWIPYSFAWNVIKIYPLELPVAEFLPVGFVECIREPITNYVLWETSIQPREFHNQRITFHWRFSSIHLLPPTQCHLGFAKQNPAHTQIWT